jgi:hypothetical protein
MKGIIRKDSNAEKRLRDISEDLQKKIDTGKLNELAPMDVSAICYVAKNLVASGVASTFITKVADYFKSFGFIVTMEFDNVQFVIVA